jgi:hypothetical protein
VKPASLDQYLCESFWMTDYHFVAPVDGNDGGNASECLNAAVL